MGLLAAEGYDKEELEEEDEAEVAETELLCSVCGGSAGGAEGTRFGAEPGGVPSVAIRTVVATHWLDTLHELRMSVHSLPRVTCEEGGRAESVTAITKSTM